MTSALRDRVVSLAPRGVQSGRPGWWRGAATTVTERIWPLAFGRAVLAALEVPEDAPAAPDSPPAPAGFPADVPLFRTRFERFDGSGALGGQWRAIPGDEAQLVRLAQWAKDCGVRLRPLGAAHSWSPTLDADDIVLDLRRFTKVAIEPEQATFGAALTLERAAREMEARGWMFADVPAIGEATVAGAAALGTHGTGFTPPGGTLSAGIVAIRALVFTPSVGFRWFRRGDPEFPFVAMHVGSLLVTEVAFETKPATQFQLDARNMSAVSYFTGRGSVSLTEDLRAKRAIELMWFPHQGTTAARLSLLRRAWDPIAPHFFVGRRPYSEVFVNFATRDTDGGVRAALRRDTIRPGVGRNLQRFFRLAAWRDRKLTAEAAKLYSSGFILRFRAAGWCLVTREDKVPELLGRIATELHALQQRWHHAWTGPVEVRITSVDPVAEPFTGPILSAARSADPDAVAVWLNALGDPNDETGKLMREVEDMLLDLRPSLVSAVRGEWSKAFAFDVAGRPWSDPRLTTDFVDSQALAQARAHRRALDPHGVFASPHARRLL